MLQAKKNWKFLPPPNPIAINQLQEELKTTKNPYFLSLLVNRGILNYFEDMQVNEVAEKLNVPINTIKTRLFRGKHKLKTLIKDNMHLSTL
jgi:hypothetical protein